MFFTTIVAPKNIPIKVLLPAFTLRYYWRSRCAIDFLLRRTRMPALQAGTQAPEFSLTSHDGKTLALSSFRGRRTVVSFLPFAFTGG
jgi:hypothetical protein